MDQIVTATLPPMVSSAAVPLATYLLAFRNTVEVSAEPRLSLYLYLTLSVNEP